MVYHESFADFKLKTMNITKQNGHNTALNQTKEDMMSEQDQLPADDNVQNLKLWDETVVGGEANKTNIVNNRQNRIRSKIMHNIWNKNRNIVKSINQDRPKQES